MAWRGTELIVVTITLHAKNLDLYTQLEFSIITSNPLLLALSLSRRYCPCLSFTSPKKYLMKKTGLIGVMYHHAQKQAWLLWFDFEEDRVPTMLWLYPLSKSPLACNQWRTIRHCTNTTWAKKTEVVTNIWRG